jgi:hypothetical protein
VRLAWKRRSPVTLVTGSPDQPARKTKCFVVDIETNPGL